MNPLLSEDQLQLAVIDTVSDATTYPAHPNFAAISNALTPKLDAVWAEGADIQAALTDVCTAIQPLLEK